MEAQRFPDDFEGIIAGAPAFDWTGIGVQMIRNMQVLFPDPKKLTPMFTPETLKTVETAIVAACDMNDGVKDGVIADPRQCKFDINTLPLPAAQKNALKLIYAPTANRDGEIYPGQPFGGEGQTAGWPQWITGVNASQSGQPPSLRFAFGTGIFISSQRSELGLQGKARQIRKTRRSRRASSTRAIRISARSAREEASSFCGTAGRIPR
jgi:feruloyl esterase